MCVCANSGGENALPRTLQHLSSSLSPLVVYKKELFACIFLELSECKEHVASGYRAACADDFSVLLSVPHVHVAHDLREDLVHVRPVFRAALDEGAAPDLRQGHALHRGNLSLVLQVHLVAHEEDGHPVGALDPRDLVPHGLDVLEGLVVGQAVGDDETLPVLDVEVAHASELLRAGRVQDLQHARIVIHLPRTCAHLCLIDVYSHLDFLPVEVLDGRIVLLYEMPGHELDREGGLAHAAGAQHHHFELTHGVVGRQWSTVMEANRYEGVLFLLMVKWANSEAFAEESGCFATLISSDSLRTLEISLRPQTVWRGLVAGRMGKQMEAIA